MIPLWVALAAGVGALPVAPQAASGGPAVPRIVAARLLATVEEEGWATVRLTYEVEGAGLEDSVALYVLDFGPARVRRLEVDGVPVAMDPTPGRPARWVAELAPIAGRSRVVLAYRVEGAWAASGPAGRVRLPVVGMDLPVQEAAPALFRAGVRIPAAWSVSGTFPTGLARAADGSWTVDLAVIPSLVGMQARSDGSWRPGLPLLFDVFALAVLLGFGGIGLRHLRAVVARPEGGA